MWYLIRLNNKKDKERAEEALRTSQWSFLAVSSLIGAHQPQSAIVSLLNTYVTDSYLISDEGKTVHELSAFLSANKLFFQRVRCRIGRSGHVYLDQHDFDQFVLTLQIPKNYKVICVNELPDSESLKELTIPYGPIQGLKGQYLNTKTPAGKRFYINVLNLFFMEVRIPIKDVKRSRQTLNMELSYFTDQRTPHWYLLSSTKGKYIDSILGNSANSWNENMTGEPMITYLPVPNSEEVIQTIRYLYQAIYLQPTKDGDYKEVNLMPHYYFFRTNRYDLETFRGSGFNSHIYVMRNPNGTPIQIPDAQMRTFRRFLKERSEATDVLDEDFKEGDTVQVTLGVERDNEIEGTIQIVTPNHYILVSENGFKVHVRKKKKKK